MVRDTLLGWIEQDRERLIRFLSEFVAVPSPNPPGDTREAAGFIHDAIAVADAPVAYRTARPEWPNVTGTFECARPGRHLVLNGHIDVFPAGPADTWTRDPWSGTVSDGRVHGRGVTDMKCGTAASIWTYLYLHRLRDKLAGRLTLTCVSDEETGGTWGAKWLVETFGDEFRGDCMLNGEPSTPSSIRFGEKGTLRVAFEIKTPGAHGAYTHLSRNAIRLAADLIRDLYALEGIDVPQTPEIRRAIEASGPTMDRVLGVGASGILNRVTVSPGVIQGGLKINMLPGDCRIEVDIRLPVGLTHDRMIRELDLILKRHPEARMLPVWTHSAEPTVCDPAHPMMSILKSTVTSLSRSEPVATVSLGATDAKHWRRNGVPSYVYGCSPNNMAKPDEWVDIEEYLHIVRTHALAAATYLSS